MEKRDEIDIVIQILKRENRGLSIREIKKELEKIGIRRSVLTILQYLKTLEKGGKVKEQNG